ncbi:MAG: transcription-repair coupling factor [bacterium]|nr:transcription-repair coupling factor [bacterium]
MDKFFSDFIYNAFDNADKIKETVKKLELRSKNTISGMSATAKAFFVWYLAKKTNRPVLFLASNISRSIDFQNKISILEEEFSKFFAPQETSPYQLVFSNPQTYKNQLEALNKFNSGEEKLLIINATSLLTLFPSKDFLEKNALFFEKKKEFNFDTILDKLATLGYKRENMVSAIGEFSLRGDILDIYPINDEPVRIEFWGDEIESIRYFNINSQKTIKFADSAKIEPRFKIFLNDKTHLRKSMDKLFEKQINEIEDKYKEGFEFWYNSTVESLSEQGYFEGAEYFAPIIEQNNSDIFDYLRPDTLIIIDESHEVFSKCELADKNHKEEYQKNIDMGMALKLPTYNHLEFEQLLSKINNFAQLNLNSFVDFENEDAISINSSLLPRFDLTNFELGDFLDNEIKKGQNIIVSTQYPSRINDILKDFELPFSYEKAFDKTTVNVIKADIYEGFVSDDMNLTLITDVELFNRKIKKPTIAKKLSKREDMEFIYSINDLAENDLVVHSMHGIGRYLGLTRQEVAGELRDYLAIEYANSDKLYIPAEQINMLARYRGSTTIQPKLSKMGGTDWNTTKSKVKKAVDDIAFKLINLYAKRKKSDGFEFAPDSPWQMEMEDAFLYTETPDQMKAIIDTKEDMESKKPMDRLICGDVGFGKTEVALRAAFKAVMSGKQVAFLAPTTILAQQHYLTLKERFAPYGVKIELFSRFRTPKEIKKAVNALIDGTCDIAIGTHRLLQKDIEFKRLGLVIIDEEHRFGVAHKEKLKEYRTQVDVLAMSATPIPRTLYMSVSGVRDMSLINTPPVNRLPIKTFVGEYNPAFIKSAINYELEREGQAYILYNRVQSIHHFANEIKQLLPNARIAVAHGQMSPKELEEIIYQFSIHNYDVLVCTTIIESGIDIPNANTMIIYDADKFGLAQLYQLRGRIGRCERQAYAYCFYKKDKVLTQEAANRLKAIKDFTTLGSGYQIAMRDLEIRGVGNILGAQQHGHMISVGFDVYCDLLEDAIKTLQGEKVERKEPPVVDINITAFIPDDYVGNKQQKMIEYKRLADVASIHELEILHSEWEDRFGKMPDTVEPLFRIIKLRLLADQIGIKAVREAMGSIKIHTDYSYNEWFLISNNLDRKVSSRLRFIQNQTKNASSSSIIHFNNTGLSSQEVLDLLEHLFYHIKQLQSNFVNKEEK